jgi:hypothetical protein
MFGFLALCNDSHIDPNVVVWPTIAQPSADGF